MENPSWPFSSRKLARDMLVRSRCPSVQPAGSVTGMNRLTTPTGARSLSVPPSSFDARTGSESTTNQVRPPSASTSPLPPSASVTDMPMTKPVTAAPRVRAMTAGCSSGSSGLRSASTDCHRSSLEDEPTRSATSTPSRLADRSFAQTVRPSRPCAVSPAPSASARRSSRSGIQPGSTTSCWPTAHLLPRVACAHCIRRPDGSRGARCEAPPATPTVPHPATGTPVRPPPGSGTPRRPAQGWRRRGGRCR